MRTRYWMTWFVVGTLFGTGLVGLTTGIGFLILAGLLVPITLLLIGGIPGMWMGIAGGGLGVAAAWGAVVLDPNAPDDEWWPIVAAAALFAAGVTKFRLTSRGDGLRRAGLGEDVKHGEAITK